MSPNLEAHFNEVFRKKTTSIAFTEQIQRLKNEIAPEYVVFLNQYATEVLNVLSRENNTVANDNFVKNTVLQETDKIGASLVAATRKRRTLLRDVSIKAANDNWWPQEKAA